MGTVPTMSTTSAGGSITAALWNSNVRDGVNWFLSTRPMAILRQTVAQSIPNGATTGVTFDAEDADTDSGHSTVSNTSRYTANTAGKYLVIVDGSVVANAAGRVEVGIRLNGATMYGIASQLNSASNTPYACVVAIVPMIVGDYVEMTLFQNSGGAINSGVANNTPRMQVMWVTS